MEEGYVDDLEDEEDDWLDTRWGVEPGSSGLVEILQEREYCETEHLVKSSIQSCEHTATPVTGVVREEGAWPVTGVVREEGARPVTGVVREEGARPVTGDVREQGLVTRMQLNDNKAGMEGLDKEKINQIIYEASKGSKYFENEKKKEEQVQHRITDQQTRQEKVTPTQLKQGLEEADRLLEELEASRDLSHTIVHIDMDAYYAAVEMRDDPSLRDKPMAVGGSSMLSTSNYLARKFGVRAAMPGFIGKKLCPNLVLVKPNYKQYTAVSQQIRHILTQYDPNFCPMSLDEAYLDVTEHLKKREQLCDAKRSFLLRSCNTWETTLCLCDLNEVLQSTGTHSARANDVSQVTSDWSITGETDIAGLNDDRLDASQVSSNFSGTRNTCVTSSDVKQSQPVSADGAVCKVCGKPFPSYTVHVFGKSVEEAVREIRCRIEQKTRLTASAGIAPNMMLAKVCSDRNKPNGQYRIQPVKQEVMDFIKNLPIRKISGIGKVSEMMLHALGIVKCQDLYEKRALLYHLYSPISFHHFMRICLAVGSTKVERDGERKSISTERTFSELSRPSDLYKKCSDLCTVLVEDLVEEELQGKTVSIKIKTVKFEVKTRAHTLTHHTMDFNDIYTAARELLRVEIQAVQPQALRLRLMGVRMSNLLHQSQCVAKRQDTITGLFKKMSARGPQKTKKDTPLGCCLPYLPSLDVVSSSDETHLAVAGGTDVQVNMEQMNIPVEEPPPSESPKLEKTEAKATKSVKLLFKPKNVHNSEDKTDVKEINNNTPPISSKKDNSTSEETENNQDKKNVADTNTGKGIAGRKKTKNSISSEFCRDGVSLVGPSDSSGESSGYESSKQPVEKQHTGVLPRDSSETAQFLGRSLGTVVEQNRNESLETDGHDATSSTTRGGETQEIEKLKLFQCPVCQEEVECRNLNYFNDHVDVCLFRQISSQGERETNLSVVDHVENSLDTDTESPDRESNPQKQSTHGRNNGLENSKQKLDLTPNIAEESVETFRKISESKREPIKSLQFEKASSSLAHSTWTSLLECPYEPDRNMTGSQEEAEPPFEPNQNATCSHGEAEFYACPICNVEKIGCSLEEFNEHVDSCLSRRAIKQILEEQEKLSPIAGKRCLPSSPTPTPPTKRKKKENGGQMKTIDSFFKP